MGSHLNVCTLDYKCTTMPGAGITGQAGASRVPRSQAELVLIGAHLAAPRGLLPGGIVQARPEGVGPEHLNYFDARLVALCKS